MTFTVLKVISPFKNMLFFSASSNPLSVSCATYRPLSILLGLAACTAQIAGRRFHVEGKDGFKCGICILCLPLLVGILTAHRAHDDAADADSRIIRGRDKSWLMMEGAVISMAFQLRRTMTLIPPLVQPM